MLVTQDEWELLCIVWHRIDEEIGTVDKLGGNAASLRIKKNVDPKIRKCSKLALSISLLTNRI